MAIEDKLLKGSYQGVEFFATSFSTGGGRKKVVHTFPNSDKQFIEDLGRIPRSYGMTLIIAGGDSYFLNRDNMLRVLENGDDGKLVHPIYGDIENIVASEITVNETLTELGEGKITVIFKVSEGTGIPEKSGNSLHQIETDQLTATIAFNSSMAAEYKTSTNFPNSYVDSLAKANKSVTAFRESTSFVQASADKINEFTAELNAFETNITSLVRQPQAFADSVQSLFTTMGNLHPTVDATIAAIERLFIFGADDVAIIETTPALIEQAKNRKILNDVIQSNALVYSYLNSAQLNYETVNDIDKRAGTLDVQYKKLSESTGLDDSAKQSLSDMRVNMQSFFETQKLTALQIITVNTNPISARLLAFQYYGSDVRGEALAELNNTSEPSFLEDDVEIFTA